MEISMASKKDIPEIMNLIDFCIQDMESQGIYQWNEYYPAINHINEGISENSLYLLKDSENYLGIISLTEKQPPEYRKVRWSHEKGKVMVITKLAVNPEHQKQGIGRKLMDFAENMALNEGYNSIRLDTYSANPRAIKLYEKRGYKRIDKVHFPLRDLPFYCYEKLIKS